MSRDPYVVLGLRRSATDEDIKKAYHRFAKELHPDLNLDDADATERMQQVNEAYEVLKDPVKRARYSGKKRSSQEDRSSDQARTRSEEKEQSTTNVRARIRPEYLDLGIVEYGHQTQVEFEFSAEGSMDAIKNMNIAVKPAVSWMKIEPIPPETGLPFRLKVSIDTRQLSADTGYFVTISFQVNDSIAIAKVNLRTRPGSARPQVDPPIIDFGLVERGDSSSVRVRLYNEDGPIKNYKITIGTFPEAEWLLISDLPETMSSDKLPFEIMLSLYPRALYDGRSYATTLRVQYGGQTAQVPVRVKIVPYGWLTISDLPRQLLRAIKSPDAFLNSFWLLALIGLGSLVLLGFFGFRASQDEAQSMSSYLSRIPSADHKVLVPPKSLKSANAGNALNHSDTVNGVARKPDIYQISYKEVRNGDIVVVVKDEFGRIDETPLSRGAGGIGRYEKLYYQFQLGLNESRTAVTMYYCIHDDNTLLYEFDINMQSTDVPRQPHGYYGKLIPKLQGIRDLHSKALAKGSPIVFQYEGIAYNITWNGRIDRIRGTSYSAPVGTLKISPALP